MVGQLAAAPMGYRHEALFYERPHEFVDRVSGFVRDALDVDEPIFVVVAAEKIATLRRSLGGAASQVLFADMGAVGANPARILAAWREFVATHGGSGARVRGVSEPVTPGRTPAEVDECHLHEALLNVMFAPNEDFWLLCAYDSVALGPEVVAEASMNHPFSVGRDVALPPTSITAPARYLGRPLADVPAGAAELRFGPATLGAVRAWIRADLAGLAFGDERSSEIVLAVSELASNSVRHGGGEGEVRVWVDADAWYCQVSDRGVIDDARVGRIKPASGSTGGYGLWLANQLCDLVQVRSGSQGTTVRLHVRRVSPG